MAFPFSYDQSEIFFGSLPFVLSEPIFYENATAAESGCQALILRDSLIVSDAIVPFFLSQFVRMFEKFFDEVQELCGLSAVDDFMVNR